MILPTNIKYQDIIDGENVRHSYFSRFCTCQTARCSYLECKMYFNTGRNNAQ